MTEPVSKQPTRLVVMSGAPGSGKTAVIERLRDDVRVVTEPARAILAEQRASGGTGTWDQDIALFVRLLLERAVADHQRARMRGGITVFDRGIPDCVVYADRAGVDRSSSVDASITYRYEREVLFFEPWREIYTTDDERTLDFDGAAAFGEDLMNEYSRCGYSIVTVPKVSVADRVAFVHARIDTPAN